MRKLAVFTNKGGIGKTTIATNLAERSAADGQRVLFVDMDPQNNATMLLLGQVPVGGSKHTTVVDIIKPVRAGAGLIDGIKPAHSKAFGVDVIAAGAELSLQEDFFGGEWAKVGSGEPRAINATWSIHESLKMLEADYDLMIMDCGPSLGALTRVGLLACDSILSPIAQDQFSLMALDNMARWLAVTAGKVQMAAQTCESPGDAPPSAVPSIEMIIPTCAAGPQFTDASLAAVAEARDGLFPAAEIAELLHWAPAPLNIAQHQKMPISAISSEHGLAGAAFAQRHRWVQAVDAVAARVTSKKPDPSLGLEI